MHTYTEQWSASPPRTTRPYDYDLAYEAAGRIPRQRYTAVPSGLATVDASYYSDVRSRGSIERVGMFRPQFADAYAVPVPVQVVSLPARRT